MRFTLALFLAMLPGSLPSSLSAAERPDGLYAEIITPRGALVARLEAERAPLTVTNFVGLAEGTLGPNPGKPFFDGLTFHRVVPGFVIQGGDPWANGEGGPGYDFPDEFSPALHHDRAGVLSMANSGPDTNGSQFFITLAETNRLDYLHSVFGAVIEGLDVLPRIEAGDTMTVRILRVGAAARALRADQAAWDALVAAAPKALPPHLLDPDRLLPTAPAWAEILDHKLANFERFTGARVFVALHTARSPEDHDAKSGALAERYARRCQARADGIIAVYYADRQEWALWIGETRLSRFNPARLPLHDAKTRFLAEVATTAERAIAKRFPAGDGTPEQLLKLRVDALLAAVITLLEPPVVAP